MGSRSNYKGNDSQNKMIIQYFSSLVCRWLTDWPTSISYSPLSHCRFSSTLVNFVQVPRVCGRRLVLAIRCFSMWLCICGPKWPSDFNSNIQLSFHSRSTRQWWTATAIHHRCAVEAVSQTLWLLVNFLGFAVSGGKARWGNFSTLIYFKVPIKPELVQKPTFQLFKPQSGMSQIIV